MTCGTCMNSQPDAAEQRRARALICHVCIYAEHDTGPWDGTAVTCTVDGLSVEQHVTSCQPSCPRGKHPSADGMVRWCGIEWYGVPAWMRWVLAYRLTGSVPGCGCIRVLKDLWLRLKAKLVA